MGAVSILAGVRASAGGVQALQAMFAAVRPGQGIAYVVQLHLDPNRSSALAEILSKDCPLRVETAVDGAAFAPDLVLVVPPGVTAAAEADRLRLRPEEGPGREFRQIDALFSSLALACGEQAVGVVLSGFGSDGTLGIKAIKEHGGLTIAQGADGSSPGHPEMPESAIAGGLVDLVLPAAEIPGALADYARSFETLAVLTAEERRGAEDTARIESARQAICSVLRREVGHDFSGYKERSFLRRVQRRMQVRRIPAIETYAERLRGDHEEARALLRDLLIGVTAFFRDPEAFAELEKRVIPRLFDGKGADDAVRVWVPGCATGEEVYSIAILLREHAARRAEAPPRLQVFGTDIDEAALQIARAGHYPAAELEAVAPERRDRFFQPEGSGRTVSKEIREMCVFSSHSLIRDPPFSRLDLISCRNLLIYLEPATQRDLFPVFHFALRPGGYVFLGSAESIGPFGELFRPLDKHNRIYQRRDHVPVGPRLPLPRPVTGLRAATRSVRPPVGEAARSIRGAAEAAVLDRFAPAHVVVNQEGDVIHFSGRTGRFLEAAPGQPTRNLLALARRGLRLDLRTALQEATRTRRAVTHAGIDPERVGAPGRAAITVDLLGEGDPAEPLLLVVFEEAAAAPDALPAPPPSGAADPAVLAAERELRDTRERLQSLIEEYDTTVEELRASNEELVSVNEELQSANEELETSKEEQQSVNEELQTVNHELQAKVEELDRANADMRNLFDATRVATIMLDGELAIRGFTPAVTGLFNLLPSDRGRPFADIAGTLDTQSILADARQVLAGGPAVERRIEDRAKQRHFLLRVLPYRAADGRIDGALAALVDVTQLVEAVEAREHHRMLLGELNHRVRNMLQVVIGLTRQTLKEAASPEEFGTALIGRMQAMSKAYQLFAREEWGDVALGDLVVEQLGPHLSNPGRSTVAGPVVLLRPASAVALGLVLHELATNAVKYGALSTETGTVAVTWEKRGEDSIALEWCEHGGPLVAAPDRQGFGSELLRIQVERALRGSLQRDYRPEGVCIDLVIPLDSEPAITPPA